MKNRKSHRNLAAAAAVVSCISLAGSALAQQADQSQEKIHLMVAAISANENGDFAKAKSAYEELLKMSPNDKRVQELLSDVNAKLEAQAKAEAEAKAAEEAAKAAKEAAEKAEAEAKAAKEAAEKAEADAKAAAEKEAADKAAAEKEAAEAAEKAAAEKKAAEDALIQQRIHKQDLSVTAVYELIDESYAKQDDGRYEEAVALLEQAETKLEDNTNRNAEKARSAIRAARAGIARERAYNAIDAKDWKAAKTFSDEYTKYEEDTYKSARLARKIARLMENPYNHKVGDVSPDFALRQERVKALLQKGQVQYLQGDFQGAKETYIMVEALDPTNVEAKGYLYWIAKKLSDVGALKYKQTREDMLQRVDDAWRFPVQYQGSNAVNNDNDQVSPVQVKLNNIKLPEVSFPAPGVSLEDALNTLAELSILHDPATKDKGVNIIARGVSDVKNVSLTVRNLSLAQILNFVTKQAGCQYDIEDGAIIVSKATVVDTNETADFPISNATVTRMVGLKASSGGGSEDAFSSGGDADAGSDSDQSAAGIKKFLIKAGVDFGPGSDLAYDGTKLWVTNTRRNIDKVRNILNRYSEVLQVEIEAKFMEVNQGKLNELGFNWAVYNQNTGNQLFTTMNRLSYNSRTGSYYQTPWGEVSGNNRNLSMAHSLIPSTQSITITKTDLDPTSADYGKQSVTPIDRLIPGLPATMNLADGAISTASTLLGVIDGYNIDLMVSAIQQSEGSDILCAPKVSVVSGSKATITVAQEMLYPASWGDMQSNVGSASGDNSSAAGVTITPGTPQDFTKRNVGVTMDVTPRVEEDGSISLELNPEVVEFEGFMEYGGVAVAISGDTTVTVPAGFLQPVFSVRSVNTTVTVFDGATVVLGGLTREEVKTVHDQVPILGDIPGLGRIFQSKGESRQKKNLLIFVTANRINPGGSLTREKVGNAMPNGVFSNPIVTTPGASMYRVLEQEEPESETK